MISAPSPSVSLSVALESGALRSISTSVKARRTILVLAAVVTCSKEKTPLIV
jgi:hypothetical protein